MSNNPFDRNKTKEARLGEIITEPGEQNQRDAVHIAVVPVQAGYPHKPGERVGVTPDGKRSTCGGTGGPVGIVDPFLTQPVLEGQTFWLFLFQGSVHTLRHEWTHPAFPPVAAHVPEEAVRRAASEVWLRAYAMRIKPYDDRETAYSRFLEEIRDGEIFFHGTDSEYECRNDHELMGHILTVTGINVDRENLTIRCSC